MTRPGLMAAAVLALAANGVALVGVARNRAGEPRAELNLTEREAPQAWVGDENSGLSLRLEWAEPRRDWSEPGWFGREELEAAGFDCSLPLDAEGAELRYRKVLPIEAYAALEYDGEAWRTWLAAEEADLAKAEAEFRRGRLDARAIDWQRQRMKGIRVGHTRLFLIDVDREAARLRERHPDGSRTLVAHALVRLDYVQPWDEARKKQLPPFLRGSVESLLVDSLHVPRAQRATLGGREDQLRRSPVTERGPMYAVRVAYGSRLEPWIANLRSLAPTPH